MFERGETFEYNSDRWVIVKNFTRIVCICEKYTMKQNVFNCQPYLASDGDSVLVVRVDE